MTDVLIYGDTIRHPELRHEVPLTLGDPFLYAEKDGRRHILITDFEWPRIQEAGVAAELISPFELGSTSCSRPARGTGRSASSWRCAQSSASASRVRSSRTRFRCNSPIFLREKGVELTPDRELFDERRRVKNETELAGVRRAQRAAEAGMDAARALFRAPSSRTARSSSAARR
jgi:Xaa-Pro aminopeptidase